VAAPGASARLRAVPCVDVAVPCRRGGAAPHESSQDALASARALSRAKAARINVSSVAAPPTWVALSRTALRTSCSPNPSERSARNENPSSTGVVLVHDYVISSVEHWARPS
jgi:hypothetical protein